MSHWIESAVFYHIYPLGFCGAEGKNDQAAMPVHRLDQVTEYLGHLESMGINALYLGPVFESTAHGYDTIDYFQIDRRLGDVADLKKLCQVAHAKGIRIVLDGVLNHVGRDFHHFRDVRERKTDSSYVNWFANINFNENNHYRDGFRYEGWNGHEDLVKLNLKHPDVIEYLLAAAQWWIETFEIDGLRLDAAECMDMDFLKTLARFCKQQRPDFWLLGEAVHGDYRTWVNTEMLDSMTNYECYKGLYSSFNDANLFEIEYALTRQYGSQGMYKAFFMYNFADNHDVNRVASQLKDHRHLYPLYCLLLTMPGVPSIYYGSEWGSKGEKTATSDQPLRPSLKSIHDNQLEPALHTALVNLIQIRKNNRVLQVGEYKTLSLSSKLFAFQRADQEHTIIVIINASDQGQQLSIPLPEQDGQVFRDALNQADVFQVKNRSLEVFEIHPFWARILVC